MVSAIERARDLRIEFERMRCDEIVVTGFSQKTALGNTWETWWRLNEGKTGIAYYDTGNPRTKIAAPIDFDPNEYFTASEQKILGRIHQLSIVLAWEACRMAKLLDEKRKIPSDFNRDRTSCCVASGIGYATHLIDVHNSIYHSVDKEGNPLPPDKAAATRVYPYDGLLIFPEEVNAQTARYLGASGWGMSSVEACATGGSSIAEGARLIRDGYADIVICGGIEEVLYEHPEIPVSLFSAMRNKVLSKRNDDPGRASRPFDIDRDGFALGSGGGIVILERGDLARKRGAKIYGRILGFEKSMDGNDPTSMDVRRVAKTIMQAMWDEKNKIVRNVDAIFAHATSTGEGDPQEIAALRLVFGDDLRKIPITAIKSMLGHLVGGAGAVNFINALLSIKYQTIPQIRNLENPEKDMEDLYFVRNEPLKFPSNRPIKTALANAHGFGGHNASLYLAAA